MNVDLEPYNGIDVVANLEKRWPWPDDHADEIQANDLPEHLRQWWEEPEPGHLRAAKAFTNKIGDDESPEAIKEAMWHIIMSLENPQRTYGIFHFMSEAYRVLKVGGILRCQIPTTESRAAFQDPTHVSYWNENTLAYFLRPEYKGIYPNVIRCNWKPRWVGTTIPNPMSESWVKFVLEKAPLDAR